MAEPREYEHEVTGLVGEYDPRVAASIPALHPVEAPVAPVAHDEPTQADTEIEEAE